MVTQSQTPMAVERRPWWAVQQTGFSWVVEVALVVALLAGTWYAVTQVQDRDATIASQAATLTAQQEVIAQHGAVVSNLNATITQQDEFRWQLQDAIAAQRAVIAEQDETLFQYGDITTAYGQSTQQFAGQALALSSVADLDAALFTQYDMLQAHRMAAEQALRSQNTEAYEIAMSGADATAARIQSLQAERQMVLERVQFSAP